jgi:hypothetical protein
VKPTILSRLLRPRLFLRQNAQQIVFISQKIVLLLMNNQHRAACRAQFGLYLCRSHGYILHRALLTASQRLRKAVHLLWQEKPQESQLPKG